MSTSVTSIDGPLQLAAPGDFGLPLDAVTETFALPTSSQDQALPTRRQRRPMADLSTINVRGAQEACARRTSETS